MKTKTTHETHVSLPLAQTEDQRTYWERLSPVNRPATTDTYKRTMSGSSEIFSDYISSYTLAARRAINEEGVNGRFIMAGIEKIIYPWFLNPITRREVEKAEDFFTKKSQIKKFPKKAWQTVLDNNGYLPLDIYSLPGGQTFLAKNGKHVPFMSVEGIGALATHLEPHMTSIYAPLIQAVKAKLFRNEVGGNFAEFGLRSGETENDHVSLMLALYIGGKISLTSDDQAVFLFPEYFKDIGTQGHEFISAYQRKGLTLEEAQEKANEDFIQANERSALLPDIISTEFSGLPAILRCVKKYRGTGKIIMPRFDSGDIDRFNILWKKMTLREGIENAKMVDEDGYTPLKSRETLRRYAEAGFNPSDIIIGAGGYFYENCTRNAISLVYKRSSTQYDGVWEDSLKFSDSEGKGSIPGRVRIYGKDNKLIVAQADEKIDAELLTRKIVDNGRIIYNEDLFTQAERTEKTWNKYNEITYSEQTSKIIEERLAERNECLKRTGGAK